MRRSRDVGGGNSGAQALDGRLMRVEISCRLLFRAPELAGDSREQGALQVDEVSQSSRLVYAALKDMTEGR